MILILTTAHTEILALSQAVRGASKRFRACVPRIRPGSTPTTFRELVVQWEARLAVIRLLGGIGAWDDGFRRLQRVCGERGIPLIALPGDQQADASLPPLAPSCPRSASVPTSTSSTVALPTCSTCFSIWQTAR